MDLVSLLTSTTSKGNPNAWDISKAYYDAGADAWDISKAFYSNVNFSVASQEGSPTGLFFKPDGTKMYVTGVSGDDVNEYTLSTPWLVSSASYVQNFSVATEEAEPQGVFFKPDGTKMYIIGRTGDDVNEYSLSSAWDVSTASYVQNFSVSTEETDPRDIFFKPDGTKMYIIGATGDDVNEYSLSTPWDISTATYVQNFSVATEEITPNAIAFKSDGTKMYIIGATGDDVNEYSLSSAWDISTASYLQNFSVSAQSTDPQGLFFHPDGSGFYLLSASGLATDTIWQYTIGGFSVASQETIPQSLFFKPDGTKFYILGNSGQDANEYTLSTPWDITTASYTQNFSLSSQDTAPYGLFFRSDGIKMYITGAQNDKVYEYTLSSAWDISSSSYAQDFSVAAQDTNPIGIFFKPDGTKMFIAGNTGQDVNEYSLSSAWDISTASYVQNFSVSSQDSQVRNLFFRSNGTKMYVVGAANDSIYEYNLASSWDISTASYIQSLSVVSQESTPTGLFWKDDGMQFFVIGSGRDKVFSYLISPE